MCTLEMDSVYLEFPFLESHLNAEVLQHEAALRPLRSSFGHTAASASHQEPFIPTFCE